MYYLIYRSNGNSIQRNLVHKALEACNADYTLVRADRLEKPLLLDIVKSSSEGIAEITAMPSKTSASTRKLINYILEEATFNDAIDIILRNPLTLKSLILYDDKRKTIVTRFLEGWDRHLIGDIYAERAKKIKKQIKRQSYQASALAIIGLWSEEEEALDKMSKISRELRDTVGTNKISQQDDTLY